MNKVTIPEGIRPLEHEWFTLEEIVERRGIETEVWIHHGPFGVAGKGARE